MRQLIKCAALAALLALGLAALGTTAEAHGPHLRTYRVTVKNLAEGQPLSPIVAGTHRGFVRVFRVGGHASPELELIAEDGNEVPMAERLGASWFVTDVVDVGMPLTPEGTTVGDFTDSLTFEIEAKPGDKFSFATMLICTNDGFTGLDRVHLPSHGKAMYYTNAYDAGTEDNTEASEDIVDPCSALGPQALAGDPNGNEDAAVDTTPHQQISHHPNIQGGGDLSSDAHGWKGPVTKVTIERVD